MMSTQRRWEGRKNIGDGRDVFGELELLELGRCRGLEASVVAHTKVATVENNSVVARIGCNGIKDLRKTTSATYQHTPSGSGPRRSSTSHLVRVRQGAGDERRESQIEAYIPQGHWAVR
jgi:hypothetical protein